MSDDTIQKSKDNAYANTSMKILVSNQGVNFINESIADMKEEARSKLQREELKKRQEIEQKEEQRKRDHVVEMEKRHKEAKKHINNMKRSAIGSIGPTLMSTSQKYLMHPAVLRMNSRMPMTVMPGRSLEDSKIKDQIPIQSDDRHSTKKKNSKLSFLYRNDPEETTYNVSNKKVLSDNISEIENISSRYMKRRARDFKKLINEDDKQKNIQKTMLELQSQEQSTDVMLAQNNLTTKIKPSGLSNGYVKELKEVQKLSKIRFLHVRREDGFKKTKQKAFETYEARVQQKSEPGNIFESVNDINEKFNKMIECHQSKEGRTRLPGLNTKEIIQHLSQTEREVPLIKHMRNKSSSRDYSKDSSTMNNMHKYSISNHMPVSLSSHTMQPKRKSVVDLKKKLHSKIGVSLESKKNSFLSNEAERLRSSQFMQNI